MREEKRQKTPQTKRRERSEAEKNKSKPFQKISDNHTVETK
jgi:hypothetical protein